MKDIEKNSGLRFGISEKKPDSEPSQYPETEPERLVPQPPIRRQRSPRSPVRRKAPPPPPVRRKKEK